MEVHVNGNLKPVPEDHTIAALVAEMELTDKRIAIEVNEEIVPRSAYQARVLKPGDRVEVVTAIGGG